MSTFHRAAKIVAINLVLICLGLAVLEAGFRASKYLASCAKQECNSSFFKFEPLIGNQNIGLTIYDPVLGFVPKPNFDAVIEQASWHAARVSITADGYRASGNNASVGRVAALAIGDSFTFGNQVSNTDTWPSCMRQLGRIEIANAGVPGYGAAQAVLRGKIEAAKHPPLDLVVWSILVDEDFARDRLIVHSGFIKPAVILEQGQPKYSAPPLNEKASHRQYYEPERRPLLVPLLRLANHLYTVDALSSHLGLDERVDLVHPQAAPIERIIEFAFDEFSALPVKNKLVVLQYSRRTAHKAASVEHVRLIAAAKARGLSLLDTKDAVTRMEPERVWDGHHTPFGNQLVCRAILEKLATP